MKSDIRQTDIGRERAGGQTLETGQKLLICDSAALQDWEQKVRSFSSTYSLPTVQFQLPSLSDLQNRSISALAREYQMECGCTSGSFFMSVTIVILLVRYFAFGGHFLGLHFVQVGSFIGITILSSLTGKLLGLLWARWKLIKLAKELSLQVFRVS